MNDEQRGEITRLLRAVTSGEAEAVDELFHRVYDDLRCAAAGILSHERAGHTLQPTALVHEVFLRLYDSQVLQQAENRAVFFGAACRAMRQILVDYARQRNAAKRGGQWQRSILDDCLAEFESDQLELEALGEAMDQLEKLHTRQHRCIDMRYFGGFSVKEIADMLQVSVSTIEKDLQVARAFLHAEMQHD